MDKNNSVGSETLTHIFNYRSEMHQKDQSGEGVKR
jgi:hypothetical protein